MMKKKIGSTHIQIDERAVKASCLLLDKCVLYWKAVHSHRIKAHRKLNMIRITSREKRHAFKRQISGIALYSH